MEDGVAPINQSDPIKEKDRGSVFVPSRLGKYVAKIKFFLSLSGG
jgi:hypothetical protein